MTGIIRRININTFNLPSKVFFECAEREKIVTVDEHIARPRFPIGKRACLYPPPSYIVDFQ